MQSTIRLLALTSALAALVVASSAQAARRGVRVDAGGAWTFSQDIATPECPGTSLSDTLVHWGDFTLAGFEDSAYLVNDFCQNTVGGNFDLDVFQNTGDEPGMEILVGYNVNDDISAIRYTYLDGPAGQGFQWAIYSFPNGTTIVALYGLVGLSLDSRTYISKAGQPVWEASASGFDGEYFCFFDGQYRGTWNGLISDTGAACLKAAVFFGSGFESS